MSEAKVKAKGKSIINAAKKLYPIYALTPATFGYGESGHPDHLLLVNGNLYGIEFKKDENNSHTRPELKPTKSERFQKLQLKRLEAAGGKKLIIHKDNLHELKDMLEAEIGQTINVKI